MQFYRQETLRQNEYQKQEYVLGKMRERFATYGYRQIQTPLFEDYDLYQAITGTIHTGEMIKVIAPAGNVLVLRPDVTIPITRRAAVEDMESYTDKRFCYTSNVFRNIDYHQVLTEQTQAGIENFEPESTELDAEVLALAIHTLQELGFSHFKLVIGHAGFFKELLRNINLSEQETKQLQAMIQAKNVSGIETFLDELTIAKQSKHALLQVPLLYGEPKRVIDQASDVALNQPMQDKVGRMVHLLELLKLYGVESFVTFDLGLINHMDYYSDIIFQGFVEHFGKPVLMGGRYNHLAEQFSQPMPAIGFAFYMDAIFECLKQQSLFPAMKEPVDIHIFYTPLKQKEALTTAQLLRHDGMHVLTAAVQHAAEKPANTTNTSVIDYQDQQNLLDYGNGPTPFIDRTELLKLLKEAT